MGVRPPRYMGLYLLKSQQFCLLRALLITHCFASSSSCCMDLAMAEWRASLSNPDSMAKMASFPTVELIRSTALLFMSLRKELLSRKT